MKKKLENIKVFIVEDDPLYRALIKHRINSIGIYNILLFSSGESCLKMLYEKPDILLIDYELENMSGIDLLKIIKIEIPESKVIFISSTNNSKIISQAINNGAIDYIEKNFNALGKLEILIMKLIQSNISNQKYNQEVSYWEKVFSWLF